MFALFLCSFALLATSSPSAQVRPEERPLEPHGHFDLTNWSERNSSDRIISRKSLGEAIAALATRRSESSIVSNATRVNGDLLSPGGTAQAETQAEPFLAVNPENSSHLIAVYQESRFANGGARVLNHSVSFDGGETWTEGMFPHLTPPSGGPWDRASDPWVTFGPGGRVYFASLLFSSSERDNAIGVSVSTDGGLSWGSPIEVARSSSDFNDKEAVVADAFPSSPNLGNVYVAWDVNKFDARNRVIKQVLAVSRSTDGGVTWNPFKKLHKKKLNVGAVPGVGPDGTVYVVWTHSKSAIAPLNPQIYFSRSEDGGKTWSTAKAIVTMTSRDVAGIRAGESLASFAVNPINGDLFLAWMDSRWAATSQAALIYSRDRGDTWSAPQRVSDGPDDAHAFTVSVAVNQRGDVGVSYYSLRNDPARASLADCYLNISRDGGLSFEPAQRVTGQSFDLRFAAQTGEFFLGDYIGLVGTESGFRLLWVGTDLFSAINPARKQPDVFTANAE
ncbi:MAG: sialidase family protein [Blastocatellia bacterium]